MYAFSVVVWQGWPRRISPIKPDCHFDYLNRLLEQVGMPSRFKRASFVSIRVHIDGMTRTLR